MGGFTATMGRGKVSGHPGEQGKVKPQSLPGWEPNKSLLTATAGKVLKRRDADRTDRSWTEKEMEH